MVSLNNKLYCLYTPVKEDGSSSSPLTLGVYVDRDADVVRDVLEKFAAAAAQKGRNVDPRGLVACDALGGNLPPNKKLSIALLEGEDDLFLTDKPGSLPKKSSSKKSAAVAAPLPKVPKKSTSTDKSKEHKASIAKIRKDLDERQIQAARKECQALLKVKTSVSKTLVHEIETLLCRALLDGGHVSKAETSAALLNESTWEACEVKGDIALVANELQDAVGMYQKALALLAGKDRTALYVTEDGKTIMRRSKIQVSLSKALVGMSSNMNAVRQGHALLEKTVSEQEDGARNAEGMLLYGQCFIEHGQFDDGFKTQLRALTIGQTNSTVKKAVSTMFRTRPAETLKVVRATFAQSDNPGPALAFLADTAKNEGAIGPAIEMYAMACKMVPTQANFCLNYAHQLESDLQFCNALKALRSLFIAIAKDTAEQTSGLAGALSAACEAAAAVITDAVSCLFENQKSTAAPYAFFLDKQDDNTEGITVGQLEPDAEVHTLPAGSSLAPPPAPSSTKPGGGFDENQISTLGCLILVMKILFQHGPEALRFIPPLISHLDSLVLSRNLHLTVIRNEYAYYGIVAPLLLSKEHMLRSESPYEPQGLPAPDKTLFLLGDSHSLAPSYEEVTLPDRKLTIVPKLATGVKCWHLRPGTHFYPKYNFEKVVETIPSGSQVIFLFGEIDCREGIIKAVVQDKAPSLEASIKSVVGIYVQAIRQVAKKKNLVAYVHPVPPALEQTRNIVLHFNVALQTEVSKFPDQLGWLDFLPKLLETSDSKAAERPKGDGFNNPDYTVPKKYTLDGTHLNSAYVPLLNESLLKVYRQS